MPRAPRPGPGRRRCRSRRPRSRRRGGAARARACRGCARRWRPSGWPIAIAPPLTLSLLGSSSGQQATKASFYDTSAALSRDGYRVHALDLPGFGSSSKPATGPYTARWFADTVVGVMDKLGIERAHVVGNSMGGRVALEVAMREPERVGRSRCCVPPSRSSSAATTRSSASPARSSRSSPILRPRPRLLDPGGLFHDTDAIDPYVSDVVVDEFQRTYTLAQRPLRLPQRRAQHLPRPRSASTASTRAWRT